MALQTYSDLQNAVASWLARSGDSIIANAAPDFVTLAEARLTYGSADPSSLFPSEPLRIRAMETTAVIPVGPATSAGVVGPAQLMDEAGNLLYDSQGNPLYPGGAANNVTFTPTSPLLGYAAGQGWSFTALQNCGTGGVTVSISGLFPRPVLKSSALVPLVANDIIAGGTYQLYDDGNELILMPGRCVCPLPPNYLAARSGAYFDGNPIDPLEYISPQQATYRFNSQWPSETHFFSIEGDAVWFSPAPDTQANFVFPYYQKFGELSAATNWLMTNAPNIYLYASILEAAIFIGSADIAKTYYGLFMSACNGLQWQDMRDRHSGSTLVIRNDTGNP